MSVDIVAHGYIEVWRDGVKLSQHRQEREAMQSAFNFGNGTYEFRYPIVDFVVDEPLVDITTGTPASLHA